MQKTSKWHQKSKLDFTIIMSHTTLQHSKRYSSASGMNTRPLILLFIFISLTHSNVQCHLWPLHISLRSLNSWPLPFILSFSLSLFLSLPLYLSISPRTHIHTPQMDWSRPTLTASLLLISRSCRPE